MREKLQTDKQAEFSANERIPGKVYAAVIATGILSFSGVIVETSMNIAFPTLMREFGVSTNIVQWMTSIYLLTLSIVVPLSANLKARFATKSLFLTAAAFFMAGLLTDALAPIFPVLLFGRVLQGVGTGLALPLMYNIIIEQVPLAKRGSMMGGANVITGIAPAVGPTFGGIVISTLGWRWVFWILLPLLLVSLFLGIWASSKNPSWSKRQSTCQALWRSSSFSPACFLA
jgi:DHA2 family lincomycin resistance protein-like MFS transporter